MSAPRARILPMFIPHAGCTHACVFCNQRSISGQSAPVTSADVTERLSRLTDKGYELAYYGGSFTALPAEEQEALLAAARPFLENGTLRALRVSTRPDAIDGAVLERLRRFGVETVELGAQSMDDAVLLSSGRGHTAEDTRRAAALVKAGGFRLILQMMTGLPGATAESDLATARELAVLRPDGVRVYPTVILRDSPLYAMWRSGTYREHTVDEAVERCARILPVFRAAGIPVIRLGLNPSEELSHGGSVAGGAYHPALGELVLCRMRLEAARSLLRDAVPGTAAELRVPARELSQWLGQNRGNVRILQEEFRLTELRVRPAALPEGQAEVIWQSRAAAPIGGDGVFHREKTGGRPMILSFRGREPKLAPGVFVAENASVIGDVELGEGSSVWFGAVLRGDSGAIRVGKRVSLQDNVTLHCDEKPMVIEDNVTVGHNAVVHCARVGQGTLVGMGAVLLSGAEIGRNCIIAAGALVRENQVVPDNSLAVGVPAKVVKTLEPGSVEATGMHTHYEQLSREYLEA